MKEVLLPWEKATSSTTIIKIIKMTVSTKQAAVRTKRITFIKQGFKSRQLWAAFFCAIKTSL
jgi:hypothetical protein